MLFIFPFGAYLAALEIAVVHRAAPKGLDLAQQVCDKGNSEGRLASIEGAVD